MIAQIRMDGTVFGLDNLDGLNDDLRRRILAGEGEFLWPEGHPSAGRPMPYVTASRMRVQIARGSKPEPKAEFEALDRSEDDKDERPDLIPELWPHGTHVTLGGPDKAGKTTFITDLVAALVVPGHSMLDAFAPTDDTARSVWIINCENPKRAFEKALDRAGVSKRDPYSTVYVDHLREMGGPARLDLTNPAILLEWARQMLLCIECDGSDFQAPDVVVVDGLTAVAHAVGSSPESYYGPWFVAFRQLMDTLGIENSIVIGHTGIDGKRLLGGVESSANQDGLWIISSSRRFSVSARIGSANFPPTRVDLADSGRPVLRARLEAEAASGSGPRVQDATRDDAVLAFIASRNAAGQEPKHRDVRQAVGDDSATDRAVTRLVEAGALIREKRPGRGGQAFCYRLGQDPSGPAADDGNESK